MSNMMLIITVGIVILGLLSGIVVLLNNPSKIVNRYYFLLATVLVAFSVTNFVTDLVGFSESMRELALRANFSLGPLAALLFYLFVNEFTDSTLSNRVGKYIEGILFIFVFTVPVLSFSGDLLIKDIYLVEGTQVFITNEIDNLYVVSTTILVVRALYVLVSKYYKSNGGERLSLGYLLVGAAIAAGVNIVIQFLQRLLISQDFFGNLEVLAVRILPAISRSSFIVFFIFCSYSILRHQLFGIRVVLGKVFTWFGIAAFFFGGFYITIWLEQFIFDSIFAPVAILLNIFVALSLALVFSLYEKQLHHFVRTKFIFISYDVEEISLELSERLNTKQSVSEKLTVFSTLVSEVFKVEKVGSVLYGVEFDEPITSWFGYSQDEAILLENEKLITSLIENTPQGMTDSKHIVSIEKDVMAVLRTMNTVGMGQFKEEGKEVVFILGSTVDGKVLSQDDRSNIDLLIGVFFQNL